MSTIQIPPVVTPEQQLQIRNFELQGQVLSLQLQALERQAQAFMRGLKRDGYQLQRQPTGEWVYVREPEPAPVPQPETPQ